MKIHFHTFVTEDLELQDDYLVVDVSYSSCREDGIEVNNIVMAKDHFSVDGVLVLAKGLNIEDVPGIKEFHSSREIDSQIVKEIIAELEYDARNP